MPRPKRQPEQFDVAEFLRESDDDLKSALNSLLRSPADVNDSVPPEIARAGPNLIPGVSLSSGIILDPGPILGQGPATTLFNPTPGLILRSGAVDCDTESGPGLKLIPDPNIDPPEPQPKKRQFPIREMKLAQDTHTRAEQQVYECLWQNGKPIDDVSRIITLGFGTMAKMVRLSESNARINLRNLIAKLAIEEFDEYDCERALGRTYRIFNYSEILRKRREAGLLWYMRRTLGVLFVDPTTGRPIDLGIKRIRQKHPGPGLNLGGGGGINLEPAPGPNLGPPPGINLDPPYREEYREINLSETSSSSDVLLFEALSQYGVVDDDVLKRLRHETKRICPDFTDEELVHFIHSKGHLIRRRDSGISSPIGFLLTSVPKCFAGEAFQLFRKGELETREREAAEREQREAEFEDWRREQEAILADPNASEEDKKWARKMLYPNENS